MRALKLDVCACLLAALLLEGCGAGAVGTDSNTPAAEVGRERVAASTDEQVANGDAGRDTQVEALPRYFTLQLDGATPTFAGESLSGRELSGRIEREAADEGNAGAAVLLGESFSGESLGALVWQLSSAGFVHIVISQAGAEVVGQRAELSNSDRPAQAVPAPEEAAPSPVPPVAAPEEDEDRSTSGADDVVVKNIGLHVGGGPNDEPTKAFYGAPIAEHFPQFMACHQHAEKRDVRASVGVDLLVGAQGGAPKLKDFRSILKNKRFRNCVRSVFGKVRFAAPPRPTMISYSLLFKPRQ